MRLKNYAPEARVYEVFARRPHVFGPFTDFSERLMRGPSDLVPGTRELIGAFVSSLNACRFCHDVHAEAVRAFGIDPALIRQLRDDPETAAVEPRLRPLIALARRVTEGAARTTTADLDACRAAGWSEEAIEDAVLVASLFNFMNRMVSTLGIEADEAYLAGAGPRLRDQGYAASFDAVTKA